MSQAEEHLAELVREARATREQVTHLRRDLANIEANTRKIVNSGMVHAPMTGIVFSIFAAWLLTGVIGFLLRLLIPMPADFWY